MNRKVWTKEEENILREMVETGEYGYRQIGEVLNRSLQSCKSHATKVLGIKNENYIYTIYSQNEDFWTIPNALNCYWAGFSAADCMVKSRAGNKYSYSIGLALSDRCHVERFKADTDSTGKIYVAKSYKTNPKTGKITECWTANLRVHSTKWCQDLITNFSVVPNKTKRLRPLNVKDKFLEYCYLIGYTCGDGTICVTDRKDREGGVLEIRFVSASKDIISYIKYLVESIFDDTFVLKGKGSSEIYEGKNKDGIESYYSWAMVGAKAVAFYDFFKDWPVPKLERKWFQTKVLGHVKEQKLKHPGFFDRDIRIEGYNC